MSLKRTIFFSVVVFSLFSLLLLIRHEYYLITQTGGVHIADNYKLRERFRSAYETSIQLVEKIQNISSIDFVFPQPLEKLFFSLDTADDDETDEETKKTENLIIPSGGNSEDKIRNDGYETLNEPANEAENVADNNAKADQKSAQASNNAERSTRGELLDDLVKEVIAFANNLRPFSTSAPVSSDPIITNTEQVSPPVDPQIPEPAVDSKLSEVSAIVSSSTASPIGHLRVNKVAKAEELVGWGRYSDDDDDSTDGDDILDRASNLKSRDTATTTSTSKSSNNKVEPGAEPHKVVDPGDDDNDDNDDADDDIILQPIGGASASSSVPERKNGAKTQNTDTDADDDDSLDNDDFDDDDDLFEISSSVASSTEVSSGSDSSSGSSSMSGNLKKVVSPDGFSEHEIDPDVAKRLHAKGVKKPRHRKGTLTCKGKKIDSDVIYWRDVEGDADYVSPIIPPTDPSAHGVDATRYLSFEYDAGGWNNMRMSMECLIILAHAFNRTLVLPPPQHIYLLSQKFVAGEVNGKKKFSDEMGFEDFFHVDVMRSQKGMNILSMKEFLTKEGITGGLHGIYPPGNSTDIWGREVLWPYLNKVADILPVWGNSYFALPLPGHDYSFSDVDEYPPLVKERYEKWKVDREPIQYYNQTLQQARHLHVPGEGHHRILMHHYCKQIYILYILKMYF